MDLGVLGFDGLVPSETNNNGVVPSSSSSSSCHVSTSDIKHKSSLGSVLTKQERTCQDDINNRVSKIPKADDKPMSLQQQQQQVSPLLRSKEHMLSFSSVKHEANGGLLDNFTQNQSIFAFYQHPTSVYSRSSSGYGNGSLSASVHGTLNGVRGPFSPSQWMELEHQALIYKYITSSVPVPSNLLLPLKKSLYPFGLSVSGTGSFPSNPLGWGTFHLGYPGNSTDPEPGRCRRTDGKKWRCSRDAVPDQKYCERHINRGRHRSRKPVEGQTGHAATRTTNSKVVPTTSSSMSNSVLPSGGNSNSIAIGQQQQQQHSKNVQPTAVSGSADTFINRAEDQRGLGLLSSAMNLKSDESIFNIPKSEIITADASQSEFGLVSSDSLLNPSQRSSYMNYKSHESFINFSDQENQDEPSFRHFIDEWPKDQSSRSIISWPEELKSDWTRLSMAIPIAADFSSSSSSPIREKLALSPLRLSREFDTIQMSSGTNIDLPDSVQKQTNWIPISWGSSTGDPLGEVLTTSTGNKSSCKSSPAFNILAEGWDGSPQLRSSPTGVLQKTTFGSLSNSSTSGSSPRAESKNNLGSSLCDNIPGSTVVISAPIPTL